VSRKMEIFGSVPSVYLEARCIDEVFEDMPVLDSRSGRTGTEWESPTSLLETYVPITWPSSCIGIHRHQFFAFLCISIFQEVKAAQGQLVSQP